ncbi:hypothetical protein PGT21_002809 [Puccinia graminis f. sp. tritici]|uniref:Uncharacterized protein n=1 Tax=Puccinia graminis f. sp. tritici TaxID=56615 RepID=A0A5B0LYN2_PUCGR|nr:hypothetical protein PGT21_002809 [Puccinia graminis f. sp. tritici]
MFSPYVLSSLYLILLIFIEGSFSSPALGFDSISAKLNFRETPNFHGKPEGNDLQIHSSTSPHEDLSENNFNSDEESDYLSGYGSDESDDEYDSDHRSEDGEYHGGDKGYHDVKHEESLILESTGDTSSADNKSAHKTGRQNLSKKQQILFENLLQYYPGKEQLTTKDFLDIKENWKAHTR